MGLLSFSIYLQWAYVKNGQRAPNLKFKNFFALEGSVLKDAYKLAYDHYLEKISSQGIVNKVF